MSTPYSKVLKRQRFLFSRKLFEVAWQLVHVRWLRQVSSSSMMYVYTYVHVLVCVQKSVLLLSMVLYYYYVLLLWCVCVSRLSTSDVYVSGVPSGIHLSWCSGMRWLPAA